MEHPDFSLLPHPQNNSLYVHIPFCTSRCWYCDFYSMPAAAEELMENACLRIHAELEWFVAELGAEDFQTVFTGGGTPSVLPRRLLKNLFEKIGKIARPGKSAEWTVEANPETLDSDFLDICRGSGVTRLSIGVQSFHDELLAGLGRRARHADIMRAFELLSVYWQGDVNLDLMTGVPGQTHEMLFEDLSRAMAFGPGHLSLYTLTAEEKTVLCERLAAGKTVLPDGDDEAAVWDEAVSFLVRHGYSQYEVSNFSRPGKECLHNLRYWHMKPYCGAGPSGVSTLPGAQGILRIHNPASVVNYCGGKKKNWNRNIEVVSPKEFFLENLMMGLRLAAGIPAGQILERFGNPLEKLLPGLWEKWRSQGFTKPRGLASGRVMAAGDSYTLTQAGRLVLNRLLSQASAAIDDAQEIRLLSWE